MDDDPSPHPSPLTPTTAILPVLSVAVYQNIQGGDKVVTEKEFFFFFLFPLCCRAATYLSQLDSDALRPH